MAGKNNEPNWRSAAGGPPRKSKQHGWRQEEPQTGVGSGKRRFKMLFLIAGGCAAAAGIVWLILLLMPGKRSGFLAIAADPREGITRLDIPYDPYGWLSAQRLLKWMGEAGRADDHVPRVLAENPLWLDDQFDEWVEKISADSNIDPVVVYVGLHGGVNRSGDPILYTGRDAPSPARDADRPAIPLATILDKLDEKASRKRKVLLLDTGRALPDPNLGEISSDFARAVKSKLGKRIAQTPTLTVILAADEGERAWDSAHHGTTALAYGLLQTLSGHRSGTVGRDNMGSYRADELFDALRTDVLKWSKNNRPTPQTPQMIPPPEEWRSDETRMAKYAERKFFKPRAGTPGPGEFLPSDSIAASSELKDEWAAEAKLADRKPSPATYTPVAWRRYRELLLRFERAVLAGDIDGAGAIRGGLRATREDVDRGLDLKLKSMNWVLPLAASLGRTPERSLDPVFGASSLTDAARRTASAMAGINQRPVEAHLPIMLDYYVRDVVKSKEEGPLASAWKPALTTRILAERAALGVRGPAYPYSERIWPLVAERIRNGDDVRRRGEDRLHGPTEQISTALEAFQEADRHYTEAIRIAERIQEPLRLRDKALADLPFLARWLTETDESSSTSTTIANANATMRDLWAAALDLSSQIDRTPTVPAALAQSAESTATKLAELNRVVGDRTMTAAIADAATNWQSIEHLLLLPPSLIGVDNRLRLVERSRSIARKLAETDTAFAGEMQLSSEKVIRRLKAAKASLGGEWEAWANKQPDLAQVETNLSAGDKDLFDKTPERMAVIGNHRRRLAEFAKHPNGSEAERLVAELFSRMAVPLAVFPNPEPATTNARRRWKVLLEAMGQRIALDHWYKEDDTSFFSTVIAPDFLADARKLAEQIGDRDVPKSPEEAEIERIRSVAKLELNCLDAPESGIRWTTESSRSIRYALKAAPYGVPGEAVLSWSSDDPGLLELTGASRRLVDLRKPIEGGGPRITLKAGPRIDEAATEARATRIKASGYFRGQRSAMERSADVVINRRPDLVVTTVKPDRAGVIALRTDRDFHPGAVSILLDYSASMTFNWGEGGLEKKEAMIQVLRDILKQLPRGTDLKIHAFLARAKTDKDKLESEVIYDYEKSRTSFLDILEGPDGLIETLRTKRASGNTPLLATMREAIDNMKRNYAGNRTLIVLTDGADTSFHDKLFGGFKEIKEIDPDMEDRLVRAVHGEVAKLEEEDLLVQMVIFGENAAEKRLAEKMFRPIEAFEKTPGRVYLANDIKALREELDAALRPKPRLLTRNGSTIPENRTERIFIPRSGLPTNRTDHGPGLLTWRGFVPPETYQLRHYRTKQEIDFEPGDALCIRLRRDDRGRSYFHRELYFRDVDDSLDRDRIDNGNPDWLLAVPDFGYANANDYYLMTTAALEAKAAAEPNDANVEDAARTAIRQIKPTFVWWELTRIPNGGGADERFPGPVSIHNLQGLPAPAWRIVANNGSKTDGLDNRQFRLRAWPRPNDVPAYGTRAIRATLADLRAGITETIQDVTVRAALEELPYVKDPSLNERIPGIFADRPQLNLIVRVDDPKGRRFQVRHDRKLDPSIAEHRYFYDRSDTGASPKIMAYSAVFGPINPDSLSRLGEIELGLISLSEIIESADDRRKPLSVTLKNPQSRAATLRALEPKDSGPVR